MLSHASHRCTTISFLPRCAFLESCNAPDNWWTSLRYNTFLSLIIVNPHPLILALTRTFILCFLSFSRWFVLINPLLTLLHIDLCFIYIYRTSLLYPTLIYYYYCYCIAFELCNLFIYAFSSWIKFSIQYPQYTCSIPRFLAFALGQEYRVSILKQIYLYSVKIRQNATNLAFGQWQK